MRFRWLFMVCLLLLLALGFPLKAHADDNAVWHGNIKGTPAWITVISRGHTIAPEIREREPWWKWGNATTDAYIFAFRDQRDVRLILDFQPGANGVPMARIYVNQQGSERLTYWLDERAVKVADNGGHAYLTVVPQNGSWLVGDEVNYNLQLNLDGVLSGFGDNEAATDGIIDVEMRVGSQQLGTPGWQVNRLVHDAHPDRGYSRYSAVQRLHAASAFKVAPTLMPTFPYFDIGLGNEISWFKENPNPLYFDLASSQLRVFPFPGFQNGGMYYYNSLSLPPQMNFEAPYGFYNFDPASRYAQLVVRGAYYPKDDQIIGSSPVDRTSFRYSWKVNNDANWRYSLQLAGSYPYTDEVKIGDSAILGVPSEHLPNWVMSKRWPVVTFVEAVEGYPGSEGIYFYSAQSTQNFPWLDGRASTPPDYLANPRLPTKLEITSEADISLPPAFRGEYSATYQRQPKLYYSPIDARLHLLNAESGAWNLGDNMVLRTHNLDRDAYIDGWTREALPDSHDNSSAAASEIREALYVIKDYVFYTDGQSLGIYKAQLPLSAGEMLPPTDQASWKDFRGQLAALNTQSRNPANLKSWLGSINARPLVEASGSIGNVRATATGFRFTLDQASNLKVQESEFQALAQRADGSYSITYDGTFHVEPLSLPILSLRAPAAGIAAEPAVALRPGQLRLQLSSDAASADAPVVSVRAEALAPDGQALPIGERQVAALAGETTPVTFDWAPPAAGDWQIRATAITTPTLDAPPMTAHFDTTLPVAPATLPEPAQAASGLGLVPVPAVVGMLLAALLAASLLGRYLLPVAARRKL